MKEKSQLEYVNGIQTRRQLTFVIPHIRLDYLFLCPQPLDKIILNIAESKGDGADWYVIEHPLTSMLTVAVTAAAVAKRA